MIRTAALLLTGMLPTVAFATTPVLLSVVTLAAQQDQQNLCPPNSTEYYPTQFIWAPDTATLPPRSATLADGLQPRIEQWHAGSTSADAVYTSMDSNPNTCSQVVLPSSPPANGLYTFAGNTFVYTTVPLPNGTREPVYGDDALQYMAGLGCGPFGNISHTDVFRMWQPSDTFYVYPAVYRGVLQLQPRPDFYNGGGYGQVNGPGLFDPMNIRLQGVVQNNIRPVFLRSDSGDGDSESVKDVLEIANSQNIVSDSIDYGVVQGGYVAFAVAFATGTGNLNTDANGLLLPTPSFGGVSTISNARIFGGELVEGSSGGANGVAGGEASVGGTFELLNDEIDHNGGSSVQNTSGPGHNVYMPAGLDPTFTFVMQQSYSHDAYYGHLTKSRAQRNFIVGNYFRGGLPQGGLYTQAEAFDLDIPNGGQLTAADNILVKNLSGSGSNGFGLAYGEEGNPDGRTNTLVIEHNTFVTFSSTYDGFHWTVPFFFFSPAQEPGALGFPASSVLIKSNAFVGYCPVGLTVQDYRGDVSASEGFSELTQEFRFTNKFTVPGDTTIIGAPAYGHVARRGLHRGNAVIGAKG